MKIHKIRLKNLNSLVGEWRIDLQERAYDENGIFIISGPTGAGKSTILDAICLGLFGRTPRLGKVSAGTNELMSKHTGECLSEVEFEAGGKVYRSCWRQKRSRERAGEKLQAPKYELVDMSQNKIIEDKLSRVEHVVEDITGLDFHRFTRTVLLAQGAFAAFLQASASDKSPILEKITGTQIYSQISQRVHEQTREHRIKLDNLESGMSGFTALSETEESSLNESLKNLKTKAQTISVEKSKFEKILNQSDQIERLNQDLSSLSNQLANIAQAEIELQPAKKKLFMNRKASNVYPSLLELNLLRKKQIQNTSELENKKSEIGIVDQAVEDSSKALTDSEKNLSDVLSNEKSDRDKINKIRELNVEIVNKRQTLQTVETTIVGINSNLEKHQEELQSFKSKKNSFSLKLEEVQKYKVDHAVDGALISELPRISLLKEQRVEKHAKQLGLEQELKKNQELLKDNQSKLEEILENFVEHKETLDKVSKELGNADEKLEQTQQGKDPSIWRNDLEKLISGLGKFQKISETTVTLSKLENEKQSISLKEEELNQELEKSRIEEKQLKTELKGFEDTLVLLGKQIVLESKIKSLMDERNQLKDGLPCPLCGSVEHPYKTEDNFSSDAETKLESTRVQKKESDAKYMDVKLQINQSEIKLDEGVSRIKQIDEKISDFIGIRDDLIKQTRIGHFGASPDQLPIDELLNKQEQEVEKIRVTVEEIEELEKLQKRKTKEHQIIFAELKDAETAKERQQDKIESLNKVISRLEEEFPTAESEYQEINEIFEEAVKPYHFDGIENIIEVLEEKKNHWIRNQNNENKLKETVGVLEKDIAGCVSALGILKEDVCSRQSEKETHRKTLVELQGELQDKYSNKDPITLERKLKESIDLLRQNRDNSLRFFEQKKNYQKSLDDSVENLSRQITQEQRAIESNQKITSEALQKEGFQSEQECVESIIDETERTNLETQTKACDDSRTNVEGLIKANTEKLKTLEDECENSLTIEQLKEKITDGENALSETSQKVGEISQQLVDNQTTQSKLKKFMGEIEGQRKEFEVWSMLDNLIGSADGKKFRSYAQGITFDILVGQANQQLSVMSDRYILISDDKIPLELSVIDTYQADEIRSIKNLSGGESFIIGLSLALGLAQMAGEKVSIDSFFLDEGFGTLDEDALEMVLNAFSMLRNNNKIIGVISHVSGLRDRIPTQIMVSPTNSGKSSISGPGCSKV